MKSSSLPLTNISKMNQPLFSVLIANYNNTQYILQAIESVKKQTYSNWEIIIVDDFSNDDARAFYQRLKDYTNIKIHYNNCNMGCGFTKGRCVELAHGEICGFLDPDDALTPDALEDMILAHQRNPEASLVSSLFYYCDDYLNITQRAERPAGAQSDYLHAPTGYISHFATFKRNLYFQTDGINPLYRRAVDQDLYLKLEEVGEVNIINKYHYYYRIHKNALSTLDSVSQAFLWEVAAKYESCIRRNIDFDSLHIPNPYVHELNYYKRIANRYLSFPPIKMIHKIKAMLNRRVLKKLITSGSLC